MFIFRKIGNLEILICVIIYDIYVLVFFKYRYLVIIIGIICYNFKVDINEIEI